MLNGDGNENGKTTSLGLKVKRATKNVQLVLQHCRKTCEIAMLRVLSPTLQPVLQQIRLQVFFFLGCFFFRPV